MIKKTLISLVSTFSIATVACIAANAANVELKYNADLSSDTVKYVDVCYTGVDAVSVLKVDFDVNCAYTKVEYNYLLGDGGLALDQTALTMAWEDLTMEGLSADGNLHGRLKVTVPEGTGAFDVVVTYVEIAGPMMDPYEIVTENLPVLTIGAGNEDTRADFEAVPATEVGTYVDDTTTVPVKAWVASIDYSVEKLAEGAKLAWAVEGASETIETGSNTTVSGEGVVFYGFAVAGRADELASIGTVTLVAE